MKRYANDLKMKVALLFALLVVFAGCANTSAETATAFAPSSSLEDTAAPSIHTPSPTPSTTVLPSLKPSDTDGTPVDTTTVYVTKTGTKYHQDGCQYLSNSKIAISLEDAISKEYEPCSKCNPPTLSGSANSSVSVSTPEPTPTIAETQPQTIETTVYVTNTGSKYHSAGCQYLSKSQIAISLSDAKAQGYGACSKCNPPS